MKQAVVIRLCGLSVCADLTNDRRSFSSIEGALCSKQLYGLCMIYASLCECFDFTKSSTANCSAYFSRCWSFLCAETFTHATLCYHGVSFHLVSCVCDIVLSKQLGILSYPIHFVLSEQIRVSPKIRVFPCGNLQKLWCDLYCVGWGVKLYSNQTQTKSGL